MFEMVYGKISSLFSSVYKENVQKSMSSYMKLSTRELKINWNSYKTKKIEILTKQSKVGKEILTKQSKSLKNI